MGQWSQGGMIMVGDMFNHALKARVDALCTELAALLRASEPFVSAPAAAQPRSQGGGDAAGVSLFVPGGGPRGAWWPEGLGAPASVGAQNDLRYAVFPDARRLVIDQGGNLRVFDTADHRIGGVSQQQGGDQSLTFTSQHGLVRVADLAPVAAGTAMADAAAKPEEPAATTAPAAAKPEAPAPAGICPPERHGPDDDIFTRIERLADLRRKEIITEEEFAAKKTDLLSRL
jgi:hypothetical protein